MNGMKHDWMLALEQQRDLTVSRGDVTKLAEAVRRGADLRFYMTTDLYEETLYFQQTYVGEGDAFAGLMSHHHSYVHRGQDIPKPLHQHLQVQRFGGLLPGKVDVG